MTQLNLLNSSWIDCVNQIKEKKSDI